VGDKHVLRKSKLDLVFTNVEKQRVEKLDKLTSDHCVIKVTLESLSKIVIRTKQRRREGALNEICPFRTIRTALPSDVIDQGLEKTKKRRGRLLKKVQ